MISLSLPRTDLLIVPALRTAGRWWVEELAGLIPFWVSGAASGTDRSQVILQVDEQKAVVLSRARRMLGLATSQLREIPVIDEQTGDSRLMGVRAGKPALIQLARGLVFETTIDLPRAAERSMEQILLHQLERLVPLDPATVCYGWRLVEQPQSRHTIKVHVAIVKRTTLERATVLAKRLRLNPRAVTSDSGHPDPFVYWQAHKVGGTTTRRRRIQHALEIAFVLLAVAGYALYVYRLDEQRVRLQQRVTQAELQAAAVERLADRATRTEQTLIFLDKRAFTAAPLAVIDALCRAIPADSWVSELQLRGNQLQLVGTAPHATGLIARLESAPLLANAAFRSPITLSPGGGEHFEIGLEVKGASGQ